MLASCLASLLTLAASAAPAARPSVFVPTSRAWVTAIRAAHSHGQTQLALHNLLPGLQEAASGPELALVLAPLAQELEAAGFKAEDFPGTDMKVRDQAVIAAFDRAAERVAEELQPSVDKMAAAPGPDPDLPVHAAKLHEAQAHLSGYFDAKDDLFRRAYKVARARLGPLKPAEVQAALERIAAALGRTPWQMAAYGADWLHAWLADMPAMPADVFAAKVKASDALIGDVPLPAHAPDRGGLSPFGARQLLVRFDPTASAERVAEIAAAYGLVRTAVSAGERIRFAAIANASRERVALLLASLPEVLSVELPGKPAGAERRLTIRFNESDDGALVSDGDIEHLLRHPEMDLRVLEALPGRVFRVAVGSRARYPVPTVAERYQGSAFVTYVIAHGATAPPENRLVVRFKPISPSLPGLFVRDRDIGAVLAKLGLPVLEVSGNAYTVAVVEAYQLPAALEALAEEPAVLSVTPVAGARRARGKVVVEFKNADYDDIAAFLRKHDLLLLQTASGGFTVASGSGLGAGELAAILSRDPLVAKVSQP